VDFKIAANVTGPTRIQQQHNQKAFWLHSSKQQHQQSASRCSKSAPCFPPAVSSPRKIKDLLPSQQQQETQLSFQKGKDYFTL
jgi:hypothetical protein